jgi:prepilin-type processing-associated H-X9-DG protein
VDLRARCLATIDAPAAGDTVARIHRPRWGRRAGWLGGALAASLGLWVLVSTFTATPAAAALREALAALEQIDGVHIQTWVDRGPGTPRQSLDDLWAVRALGWRAESEGRVSIGNLADAREYELEAGAARVRALALRDPGIVSEFLRRGRVADNVEALRAAASQDQAAWQEERATADGRAIRRVRGHDRRGRPIVAELDARTPRVLRTESWIDDGQTALRVVTTFEYPAPASVDPALFAAPPGREVIAETDQESTIRQCTVNLRSVCAAVLWMAERSGGALPDTLDGVTADPDFDPAALSCPAGIPYVYYGAGRIDRELPPGFVLLECRSHSGKVVRAFADGHVEVGEP